MSEHDNNASDEAEEIIYFDSRTDNREFATELVDQKQMEFEYLFVEALKQKMFGNEQKAIQLLSSCLEMDPNSSSAMYELANIHAANNDFTSASLLLEKAISINPFTIIAPKTIYIREFTLLHIAMIRPPQNVPTLIIDSIIETITSLPVICRIYGITSSKGPFNIKFVKLK